MYVINKIQQRAMTTILILYVCKYEVWIINNGKYCTNTKEYAYCNSQTTIVLFYTKATGERITYTHDIYLNKENK
jgi:hypothetical protein